MGFVEIQQKILPSPKDRCGFPVTKETIGNIYIACELLEDNSIKIKIRDKGCGIDNVEKAMEPLYTTVGGERAGLGFAVMQSFMDYIKVTSKKDRGTTVVMIKKISRRFTLNA